MDAKKCFKCGEDGNTTWSSDVISYPDIELCHECSQRLMKWSMTSVKPKRNYRMINRRKALRF